MKLKRTIELQAGDVIRVPVRSEELQFQVLGLRPIRSGQRLRVTDVQVKLKVWPEGTATPVMLWPANRAWCVVKNAEVQKCS